MKRFSIKVGGASGTGINSVGMIFTKAFKRAGYYSFAYREYPSLIKGGYASYKVDISDVRINAIAQNTDVFIATDKYSFDYLANEAQSGDYLIYDKNLIRPSEEQLKLVNDKNVIVWAQPLTTTAKEVGADTIMKNTVLIGIVWKLVGLDPAVIKQVVSEIFKKSQEIIDANLRCVEAGMNLVETNPEVFINKFKPDLAAKDDYSIAGNEAIALGAVAAGVRAYYAYPMTPSSSVLHTIAKVAEEYGIIVKQAEDEITAVNLAIGSSFAGTRSMTGTSGGGFDLMSETVSLAGITETPLVVILAQRPGPATGLPTWTGQGDLNLAIYSGHGEYPKIILAPGDPEECFLMTAEAHNLAEIYQTPVLILTDKYLAECLYSVKEFDQNAITIDRGKLITENFDLTKERFDFVEDGISPRWIPGSDANVYLGNSDEHDPHGNSIEDAETAKKMFEKRMRKMDLIMDRIPEPEVYGDEDAVVSFVTWGSNKHIILDAINELASEGIKANMLYYKYVYPLKTDKLIEFADKAKKLVIVEQNYYSQLGDLILQNTDIEFDEHLVRYDGRPFFVEEIVNYVKENQND